MDLLRCCTVAGLQIAMNFNQEELEQWAMAAKQKEDDNSALEAYARADESKIKDLTLSLEKLTLALAERKRDLERETTETQVCSQGAVIVL